MSAPSTFVRHLALLVPVVLVLSCARQDERAQVTSDQVSTPGFAGAVGNAAAPPPAEPPPAPEAAAMLERKRAGSSLDLAGAADAAAPAAYATSTQAIAAPATAAQAADPMLIRTGSTSIEVDSLELAIDRVRRLAVSLGGFVAGTSAQTGSGEVRSASLELRLPAARFDEALGGLRPLGEVESVNVNTQDVGEEFVDVTARIATGRQLEERLVRLLQTRTGKLDDVLAVERELARVRGEIERLEGRQRWLRARVEMSTLQVTLHEPFPVLPPRTGPGPITDAFRQAWRNLVALTAAGIASLGFVGPLAVLGVLLGLGIRRWRRGARPVTMQA